MKKRFLNKVLMLLLATGISLGSVVAANSADTKGQGCKACHEDVYEAADAMTYGHSVVQDNCGVCHIQKAGGSSSSSSAKSDDTKSLKSSDISGEVLFYLKRLPVGASGDASYLVEVEASDKYGRMSQKKKHSFKPDEIEDSLIQSSVRPAVENIGVAELSLDGIFPEAILAWETTVFATTTLEYGTDLSYGHKVFTGKPRVAYYKEHKVRLPELKRNKVYHYRVTARDLSGRIFKSRDQSFSTSADAKHIKARVSDAILAMDRNGEDDPVVEKIKAIRSVGGKVGVVVTASKPVRVSLTAREEEKESDDGGVAIERHGLGFLSPKASRIDACVECHNQGASHPVGITARTRKTKVPKGLPTLPGGIITCNTCHTPHGGDKKFFARIDFKDTTMCAECHITGPFM